MFPKAPLNYETMNHTYFMLQVSIQSFALFRLVMPGKAGQCVKKWNWVHKDDNQLLKETRLYLTCTEINRGYCLRNGARGGVVVKAL